MLKNQNNKPKTFIKMKAKNLTTIVREKNTIKLMKFFDYVPPVMANIFSVVFATSIIFEIKDILSGPMVALLSVFIVLFLVQNEIVKVKEIRKVFTGGNKNSLIPFLITFIISISLSSIGMYFYTNKSNEIKDNSTIEKNIAINDIDQKYNEKLDALYNKNFEESPDGIRILEELNYWKSKSSATLEERTEIRERIDNLQKTLMGQKVVFNETKNKQIKELKDLAENEKNIELSKFDGKVNKTKTNDFISYIFLSMILIVEFATIVLNKNLVEKTKYVDQFVSSKFAKKYLISSNMLSALYLSAKNNMVNINNAKYSFVNKDNLLEWDEIKEIYNIFISIGILSEGEHVGEKELLTNELLLSETEAQKKLDMYFERFFNFA